MEYVLSGFCRMFRSHGNTLYLAGTFNHRRLLPAFLVGLVLVGLVFTGRAFFGLYVKITVEILVLGDDDGIKVQFRAFHCFNQN